MHNSPASKLRQLATNPALFAYGLKSANALTAFIATALLARLAGPEVVGNYSFAVVTATLLGIIAIHGLDVVMLREVAGDLRQGHSGTARGVLYFATLSVAVAASVITVIFVIVASTSRLSAMLETDQAAMFGASMTLPGIAALTLTVGIAVDANVLINERIREELRHGKSPRSAVEVGYDKAFSAIIDGHVTTLISGLILAQYGTGPIKGFAITLIVGITVSLFTGVVCTRLMFDWAVRHRKVKKLHLG